MNKTDFLRTLRSELEKKHIDDIEEILADFEDHFANRIEEGKTEEEIARKIGSPEEIASDYANPSVRHPGANKTITAIGLVFLDLFVFPIFLTLFVSVLVLAVFALACVTLGVFLFFGWNYSGWIPQMPGIASLIFGISCLSLSLISVIGAWTMFQYIRQWVRAYLRWHRNLLSRSIRPSLGKHPTISKKTSSRIKFLNVVSVLILVVSFTFGYVVCALLAGSLGFWHVWHWFVV